MPPWVTTPIVYTRKDADCCGSVVAEDELGSATTRTYGFSGNGGSPPGRAIVSVWVPTAVAGWPAWSSVGAWPEVEPGGTSVTVSTAESPASNWPSAERYTPNWSGVGGGDRLVDLVLDRDALRVHGRRRDHLHGRRGGRSEAPALGTHRGSRASSGNDEAGMPPVRSGRRIAGPMSHQGARNRDRPHCRDSAGVGIEGIGRDAHRGRGAYPVEGGV